MLDRSFSNFSQVPKLLRVASLLLYCWFSLFVFFFGRDSSNFNTFLCMQKGRKEIFPLRLWLVPFSWSHFIMQGLSDGKSLISITIPSLHYEVANWSDNTLTQAGLNYSIFIRIWLYRSSLDWAKVYPENCDQEIASVGNCYRNGRKGDSCQIAFVFTYFIRKRTKAVHVIAFCFQS